MQQSSLTTNDVVVSLSLPQSAMNIPQSAMNIPQSYSAELRAGGRSNMTTQVALFVVVTNWLFVQATLLDTVSDSLQQCGCTGDVFLPRAYPQTRSDIVLTAFFSFKDCNNTRVPEATATYHLIPAAMLAVEEINNSSSVLGNFHVSLDIRDTQCDGPLGIYQLIDSYVNSPNTSLNLAILGPGCSAVSQAVAGVAGRWLNIPQVSYGYNSPTLASNRDKYPSLFQTMRFIDLTTSMSTFRLLSHLNWTHNIGVIYETSEMFTQVIDTFVRSSSNAMSGFELSNRDAVIPISRFSQVTQYPRGTGQTMVRAFMDGIVQDEIRVIVGFVSEKIRVLLLCMARNVTVPSNGFLFVFVGPLSDKWWKDDTFCQLNSEDVESIIMISGESIITNSSTVLPSGRTIHDFKVDYSTRLSTWCSFVYDSPDPLAASVYDAVWSIAKALDNSTNLLNVNERENYEYNSAIYKAVLRSLYATDFAGASGQVQFNQKGQRVGIDFVLQIQNGTLEIVGKFKPGKEFIEGEFLWFGSSTDIPSDLPSVVNESIPQHILIISAIFTFAGMIYACSMWCFNWQYAKHKILMASSQKLNYIIIIGTFLAYATIIILTILESPLGLLMSEELFKAICVIRIWILPLSFTLSYGTMFARAWRIYRIFNDPWVSNRPLRDYHLMMIVTGLGLIDILYLIPWTIIDPYRRFLSIGETNFGEFSRCSFVSCSSENLLIWLGILTVYKVLVMLAGVVVITLVRKSVRENKYFNDTKSLAAALYITASAFVVGVLLQLLFTFQMQIILAYITAAVWVNIASSGTLTSVFIPKLYAICIKHDRGRNCKTERSIFYLQHPEAPRPIGERSDNLGSLSGLNTMDQTVVTETEITGTL